MDIDDSIRRQGIKILENEQNSLDGAFDKQSDETAPEGLIFDKIEQSEDGTWSKTQYTPKETFYDENVISDKEREIKNNAEVLRKLCASVDNKIITFNNDINLLKQQIVTLSTEATGRNCNPGIAHSVGNVGVVSSFSSITTINNDVEFVKIYEKMAGPGYDAGAENPFDPDSTVILDSSYSGYGYRNVRDNKEFRNTSGAVTGLGTDGSGANIGDGRFDLTTPAATHGLGTPAIGWSYPGAGGLLATNTSLTGVAAQNRCVEIRTEINSLYDQIIEKRIERDSLRDTLNTLKDNKSEKELSHWGIQNTKNEVNIRKTKNASAISAIQNLDTPGGLPIPQGLFLHLDASNNSSYYGSGTIWYDLTDNNDSNLGGSPPANFIRDPISEERNRFDFDGTDDFIDFTVANVTSNTPTVTVELLARLESDIDTTDLEGHILFGWNKYSVWSGPISGNGTPIALGFNTSNSDLYGINSTNVNNLGLIDNFIHYVFEMRSDVSYTNNKIYINGNLQSLTKILPTNEDSSDRNFNSGNGRIAGWKSNNLYRIPMELSLFRVYNRALTSNEVQSLYNGVRNRFS
jgi:hypothetical protein